MKLWKLPTASLVLFAACSGSVEPFPPTFTIQDRAIWAGSRLVVESAAFVGTIRSPRMRLGETWLPVERVGDSSFAARVPSTFGGTYRVAIQLDGEVEELPPVEVAGMTEAQQHQVFYQLDLQVLPGTGKATIFGGADHLPGSDPQAPDYPLTLTDLTSGTTRQPGEVFYDFGGLRGPGASYLPGVYFGQTPEGSIQPFRIDAAGVTVDPSVTTLARTIIQIGPSSWARASHHYVHHVTDGSNRWITVEEAEGIAISHAAGRATFMADATPEGLPVFAMPEGTIAYFLTEVERAAGVDFSADGELLAVAGWELPSYTNDIIRTFRAADGQPVAERSLPGSPFAVAFDPVRPLIYVGLNAHEEAGELRAMSLLVLDRETLAVLGQMSTERSGLPCFNGISCYKGVIVVSPEPAVYVAISYFHPLQSYRFSIPATLPFPSSARSPHSSAGAR